MLLSEKENETTFEKAIGKKVLAPSELEAFAISTRKKGQTIVTINGSFDLLHPGHLDMLYQASLLADVFLVLLNSDASIKAYKSVDRPINPLKTRLLHMAALEMVDVVSWFEETNPISVLEKIKPDVHANGSEYGSECIEAETVKHHGGTVHIIELVEGYSTTRLIKRIQLLCDELGQ